MRLSSSTIRMPSLKIFGNGNAKRGGSLHPFHPVSQGTNQLPHNCRFEAMAHLPFATLQAGCYATLMTRRLNAAENQGFDCGIEARRLRGSGRQRKSSEFCASEGG